MNRTPHHASESNQKSLGDRFRAAVLVLVPLIASCGDVFGDRPYADLVGACKDEIEAIKGCEDSEITIEEMEACLDASQDPRDPQADDTRTNTCKLKNGPTDSKSAIEEHQRKICEARGKLTIICVQDGSGRAAGEVIKFGGSSDAGAATATATTSDAGVADSGS